MPLSDKTKCLYLEFASFKIGGPRLFEGDERHVVLSREAKTTGIIKNDDIYLRKKKKNVS